MTTISSNSTREEKFNYAISFKNALVQVTSDGARKYVYNEEKVAKASEKPSWARMPIGEICKNVAVFSDPVYTRHEHQQIQTSLSELKHRVEEKRAGNALKRIWIVFLSYLYNWCKGFGFKDSLTLIDDALRAAKTAFDNPVITDKDSVQIEGDINFSKEEETFLLEVFSYKNLRSIFKDTKYLLTNREKVEIIDHANQTFKLKQFPNCVFMYQPPDKKDYWSEEYPYIHEAREVKIHNNLNHIFVPNTALLKFTHGQNNTSVLVQRQLPYSEPRDNFHIQEDERLGLVQQLTVFLLSTNFYQVVNDPFRIRNTVDHGLYLDLSGVTFDERIDNCLTPDSKERTKGLMGFYPQYAQLIHDTAKECCNEEQWKKIESDLKVGVQRANKIVQRKKEIADNYKRRFIDAKSPAISPSVIDLLNLESEQLEIAKTVIEEINKAIQSNCACGKDLIFDRRLTVNTGVDNYTVISKNRKFILETLMPKLKQLGALLYSYDAKEAREYDLDIEDLRVTRSIRNQDMIFQF